MRPTPRLTTCSTSRPARGLAMFALSLTAMLLCAAPAAAMELTAPIAGKHFAYWMMRPAVVVTPAQNEQPKWILVATDAQMQSPVRYCRAWYAVSSSTAWGWGCNAFAIGVDMYGNDVVRGLPWGHTYYWKVVYTDTTTNEERSSEIRSFTIDNQPASADPGATSDRIFGATSDSLNAGASAFVNSRLKVTKIRSRRVARNRFRIEINHRGKAQPRYSVVVVRGPSGTQRLPVRGWGANRLKAVWKRPARDTKLIAPRYRYQALVKSAHNGAFVKSERRVVLFRSRRAARVPSLSYGSGLIF